MDIGEYKQIAQRKMCVCMVKHLTDKVCDMLAVLTSFRTPIFPLLSILSPG